MGWVLNLTVFFHFSQNSDHGSENKQVAGGSHGESAPQGLLTEKAETFLSTFLSLSLSLFLSLSFFFFRAAGVAYGSSQARG